MCACPRHTALASLARSSRASTPATPIPSPPESRLRASASALVASSAVPKRTQRRQHRCRRASRPQSLRRRRRLPALRPPLLPRPLPRRSRHQSCKMMSFLAPRTLRRHQRPQTPRRGTMSWRTRLPSRLLLRRRPPLLLHPPSPLKSSKTLESSLQMLRAVLARLLRSLLRLLRSRRQNSRLNMRKRPQLSLPTATPSSFPWPRRRCSSCNPSSRRSGPVQPLHSCPLRSCATAFSTAFPPPVQPCNRSRTFGLIWLIWTRSRTGFRRSSAASSAPTPSAGASSRCAHGSYPHPRQLTLR